MLESVYQVKPSKIAKSVLLVVFLASLALIFICDFNMFLKGASCLYLLASLIPLYRQIVSDARVQLRPLSLHDWELVQEGSKPVFATLAPDTLITPYLLMLRFHCPGGVRSYFVLRDSLQLDCFKSLLFRLKVAA